MNLYSLWNLLTCPLRFVLLAYSQALSLHPLLHLLRHWFDILNILNFCKVNSLVSVKPSMLVIPQNCFELSDCRTIPLECVVLLLLFVHIFLTFFSALCIWSVYVLSPPEYIFTLPPSAQGNSWEYPIHPWPDINDMFRSQSTVSLMLICNLQWVCIVSVSPHLQFCLLCCRGASLILLFTSYLFCAAGELPPPLWSHHSFVNPLLVELQLSLPLYFHSLWLFLFLLLCYACRAFDSLANLSSSSSSISTPAYLLAIVYLVPRSWSRGKALH